MRTLDAAILSVGNCLSLASRNIRRYCLGDEEIGDSLRFHLLDYDLRDFKNARPQNALRWSFVSQFDETVRELQRVQPAILGFSCYLWSTETSLHLAHLVKRALPDVMTVFGGPDAGPRAHELLTHHPQVDVVVEGDGEIPFLELCRHLATGSPELADIPQLRWRDGDTLRETFLDVPGDPVFFHYRVGFERFGDLPQEEWFKYPPAWMEVDERAFVLVPAQAANEVGRDDPQEAVIEVNWN